MELNKNDKVVYEFTQEVGIYMGRCRQNSLTGEMTYLIQFSPTNTKYITEHELIGPIALNDPLGLLEQWEFGGVTDLRRILYRYRLSGTLTNLMYSMNNASTIFLPHQFRPVLKFIESSNGHLLIADEVGLGKTIEACYIWNELMVRHNAKRLLVVAPAILTEKWRADLANFFDISAELVDIDQLTQHVEDAINRPARTAFTLISSLEGIRYVAHKNVKDKRQIKRKKLNEMLERASKELGMDETNPVFDLVIIDEAHYLRNSSTASYKTGMRLRDVSGSLVLLSATPVQNETMDLFNLLSLLAPEEFTDIHAFLELDKENATVIKLATDIEHKADVKTLESDFEAIDDTQFFGGNPNIKRIHNRICQIMKDKDLKEVPGANDPRTKTRVEEAFSRRIKAVCELQSQYYYSRFVTRSRKRDVDQQKCIREPFSVNFELSGVEKDLYDRVSLILKTQIKENDAIGVFRLLARQRQMASSIPAAFDSWRKNEVIQDMLYEDFGVIRDEAEEDEEMMEKTGEKSSVSLQFSDVDVDRLRRNDSKYQKFKEALRGILRCNSSEKVIVFSYFRGTVAYLENRLNEDGFNAVLIQGGMGSEKYDTLKKFKEDPAIHILLSTEVGAEGIDLQFASVEINYDLPWNPMRLEQRIGRIDRIGQKAEKIHIYNLSCRNTIADRILTRLYEKIDIFKRSIGDLEEILGDTVEKLAMEMLDPSLTPEQLEAVADQQINALVHRRIDNENLEEKAGELAAYRDYLLGEIKNANITRRYITPQELSFVVKDFLTHRYLGTMIEEGPIGSSFYITLSPDARNDLHDFIMAHSYLMNKTDLGFGDGKVLCVFDKLKEKDLSIRFSKQSESVDINHPLIKWIIATLEKQMYLTLSNVAIKLSRQFYNPTVLKPGDYIFYIQLREFHGIKEKRELHYFMVPSGSAGNGSLIDEVETEKTIQDALLHGENFSMKLVDEGRVMRIQQSAQFLCDYGWSSFDQDAAQWEQDNQALLNHQLVYMEKTVNRKIQAEDDAINTIKETYKEPTDQKELKTILLHEGRKRKIRERWEEQQRQLLDKKPESPKLTDVAVGVLVLEA